MLRKATPKEITRLEIDFLALLPEVQKKIVEYIHSNLSKEEAITLSQVSKYFYSLFKPKNILEFMERRINNIEIVDMQGVTDKSKLQEYGCYQLSDDLDIS